jgi:hypothetical protein
MNTCNECETVAHCLKHGCIPKVRSTIDMAREAGLRSAVLLQIYGTEAALCDSEIEELRQIERFAALVRADEREAWERVCDQHLRHIAKLKRQHKAGILAEREACAKLCDDSVEYAGGTLAQAIRARGQA